MVEWQFTSAADSITYIQSNESINLYLYGPRRSESKNIEKHKKNAHTKTESRQRNTVNCNKRTLSTVPLHSCVSLRQCFSFNNKKQLLVLFIKCSNTEPNWGLLLRIVMTYASKVICFIWDDKLSLLSACCPASVSFLTVCRNLLVTLSRA